MPDREKVIRGLECCNAPNRHENCPYDGAAHYNICTHHLLSDAIALLQEQMDMEPVPVIVEPMNDSTFIFCGACRCMLAQNRPKSYYFCPWCGKRVKWNA